jgi:hypothetical protein
LAGARHGAGEGGVGASGDVTPDVKEDPAWRLVALQLGEGSWVWRRRSRRHGTTRSIDEWNFLGRR